MKIEIMTEKDVLRVHKNVEGVEVTTSPVVTLKMTYKNGVGYVDRLTNNEKFVMSVEY